MWDHRSLTGIEATTLARKWGVLNTGPSGKSQSIIFHTIIKYIFIYICMCVCVFSCFSNVWLLATLWTVAHQAPLSIGFFRQEYCSGLPCPPPGGLPDPEMEPVSPTYSALAGETFTTRAIIYTQPNKLWKWCTQYATKFAKLSSGHRTGKVSFHSNPKERQCQRMLKLPHNCTHLTH